MTKSSAPIILASSSAARQNMLRKAGLDFDIMSADIDEDATLKNAKNAENTALKLACAKALHVAAQKPGALVIGADQVLLFENKILSKARTKDEAREKLQTMRGKTHQLVSAVALAKGADILWSESDAATLHMKNFDNDFLENYMRSAGNFLTGCVGAYALEETGSWLFEKTEGDFFTILGMPLLPLLAALEIHCGAGP